MCPIHLGSILNTPIKEYAFLLATMSCQQVRITQTDQAFLDRKFCAVTPFSVAMEWMTCWVQRVGPKVIIQHLHTYVTAVWCHACCFLFTTTPGGKKSKLLTGPLQMIATCALHTKVFKASTKFDDQ